MRTKKIRTRVNYGIHLREGFGNMEMVGKKHSEKSKEKMSKAHRGQKHTEEAKLKISIGI